MTTNQDQATLTSGHHLSYWTESTEPLQFSPLNQDLTADVAVVGAGIAGLSVAYVLAKAGKKVVVLDDGFVGSGETGRTTAHLSNALDDRYSEIERYHGEAGARSAAESHTAAIDFIEKLIAEESIDCDFERINGYLFLHPTDKPETLKEELAASQKAGLITQFLPNVPSLARDEGPCILFPRQAQFHPLKYLHGLAKAFVHLGGQIYTQTRVTKVSEQAVSTEQFTVSATDVVVATNTPINDIFTMHTKQWPYRSYVVGVKIPRGSVEPALWWDTGDLESKWVSEPYTYVRIQRLDEESDLVICGGQDHKTGQGDHEGISEEERYNRLTDWVKTHFPMATEVAYRWSGQVMEPLDAMAYIGKNPGDDHIYIVTGDSGNGLTHGTIAGLLIGDLILGKENKWADLYDPSRISLKVASDYVQEIGNFTAQLADFFAPSDLKNVNELPPSEGAIVNSGLQKVAVYRDAQGQLHAHSAICPHLGCVVQWNGDEKSFDCPCHGSRFTGEGVVVNGPAHSDLKKVSLKA